MSIGGKAELAQHRYHVQKYGIDGIINQNNERKMCDHTHGSDEDSDIKNISLGLHSAGGDDWDRFMDETNDISNFSFSVKTDTTKGGGVGYNTPSPDQSSDDDESSGNHFFENKEAIQSLATPEKFRYKFGDEQERTSWGVTYARGMQVQDGSSESDDSPNRSTNVSSSSTGSVLERMFQTVLRFNDDFDELSSEGAVSDGDQYSGQDDPINDKNSSVSFAANTSFGFNEDFDYPSFMKEEESSLDVDRSSDNEDRNSDKDISISFAADTSFAMSESRNTISSSLSISPSKRRDSTTMNSLSPASHTTYQRVVRNNKETLSSPSIGSLVKTVFGPTKLALSPIGSLGSKNGELKLGLDKTPVLNEVIVLPHPEIDDYQSHLYPADECTNRKLFQETQYKPSSPCLEHSNDRIDVINNKSSDCCTTQTTVESIESYYETKILSSLSEEVSPFSFSRTFGSNAAFRIDSTNGGAFDKTSEFKPNENRRGVTLFRSAKLITLGLGYKLSQSNKAAPEEYGDCTF